jgi:hypothetical protein
MSDKKFGIGNITTHLVVAVACFLLTLLFTAVFKNPLAAFPAVGIAIYAGMKLENSKFKEFLRKYGWIVGTSAIIALFVTSQIKPIIFAALLIIHAATSYIFRTMKNQSRISIEFTMLITILASFAYGAKTSAVLGAVSMLIDYAFSARFSYFMPVTITAYALIGFFAASFTSLGITAVGIASTIIYNAVTSLIIIGFMGGHANKSITFGLTDLALNFVLFTAVAPWLLSII